MAKQESLGEVVGILECRPVYLSEHKTDLIPGNIQAFLDLRLTNCAGQEKIFRVPVPEEVVDFYNENPVASKG